MIDILKALGGSATRRQITEKGYELFNRNVYTHSSLSRLRKWGEVKWERRPIKPGVKREKGDSAGVWILVQ